MTTRPKRLHDLVSLLEQQAWLASAQPKMNSYERGDRHRARKDFDAFSDDVNWPIMRRLLRGYIAHAIIEPFATEAEFWSVIVKPRYLRFNLFGQETLSIAKGGPNRLSFWLHAKLSLVRPIEHREPEAFKHVQLVYRLLGHELLYEAGGDDQIRVRGDDIEDEQAIALLEREDVIAAAKAFNLELMRKGRNPLRTFHCFALVDNVMEGVYVEAFDSTPAKRPNAEEMTRDANQMFAAELSKIPNRTRIRRETIERIGQSVFRKQQLLYWCGRCPLTGIDEPRLLRASHIKAWASCESNAERIQVYNGLLLAAHLDAAFDAGLISFADDGSILRDPALSDANFTALGVLPQARIEVTPGHRAYLAWHRRQHGFPD